MALDATKWSVNPTTKEIAYDFATYPYGNAGANPVTVLELHRWLQDLADNASYSGGTSDYISIISDTPSDKSFDTIINLTNGYYVSDSTAKYIFGGSIIQDDGGGEDIFDGVRVVAAAGVTVNVIQNGARLTDDFWNTVLDGGKTAATATTTAGSTGNVVNVSDSSEFTAGQYLTFGTVLDESYQIDEIINGTSIRMTTSVTTTPSAAGAIQVAVRGINPDAANGVAMQFMVKVKNAGAITDNGALLFTTREWYKTPSEFRIPSTGRGVNVVPLTYANDLNNTTPLNTIYNTAAFQSPFDTIALSSSGFSQIDADNDGTDEDYYVAWTLGASSPSKNQFYEFIKYITRAGETTQDALTWGIDGELFRGVTHAVQLSAAPSPGAWTDTSAGGTVLTWGAGATAGTGLLLASDTVSDIAYIQLLTGVAPPNDSSVTLTDSTNSASTPASNATTDVTVSPTVVGASTGSAIISAFGFGIIYAELSKDDRLLALDGVTYTPPNNVTFTVSNVVSGYRVLVAPKGAGTEINTTQMSIVGAPISGAAVTALDVGTIPANTPATGTLRVLRNDGSWTRLAYSGITGTSFTIPSTDFSTNTATGDAFLTYIDADAVTTSISYNTIHTADQDLFVRVRFGGTGPGYTDAIKTFQSPAVLGGTGGSSSAVQTSDA